MRSYDSLSKNERLSKIFLLCFCMVILRLKGRLFLYSLNKLSNTNKNAFSFSNKVKFKVNSSSKFSYANILKNSIIPKVDDPGPHPNSKISNLFLICFFIAKSNNGFHILYMLTGR